MRGKLILTRYSIYRFCLITCTFIMLGYLQLLPVEILGGYTYRFLVATMGLLLAISSIGIKDSEYRSRIRTINPLIGLYIFCVLISTVHTLFLYNYSLHEISVAVMPYIYVFFVYPLTFLFCKDGGVEKTVKSIVHMTIGMLLIKALSWFLYNSYGIVIFSRVLFEYGDTWVRNGVQRVNAGYLTGIALAYCIYRGFFGKKEFRYKCFVAFIVLFLWFITAFRYQFIVAVLTILASLYIYSNKSKSAHVNRMAMIIVVIIAMFSPFVTDLIDSFSINNVTLGSSTSIRLLTISHFFSLMKENNPLLGLGLLISENSFAETLLRKSQWRLFYLEDIGILGGIFKLGILSIGIYVPLILRSIKVVTSRKIIEKRNVFITGTIVYMLLSWLALNIFDLQRSFDVPFYYALVCYFYYSIKEVKGLKKNG